jgi:acylphosphatase
MEARRFLVRGIVQGVGFRYFALEVARTLGLSGYVRNLPGGCVETWAEGEMASLDKLHSELLRGPAGARVAEVKVEVLEATGKHDTFRITR